MTATPSVQYFLAPFWTHFENGPEPLGGYRLKASQAVESTTCGGGAFNARKVSFKGPFEVIMLVRCRLNGRLVPKCSLGIVKRIVWAQNARKVSLKGSFVV